MLAVTVTPDCSSRSSPNLSSISGCRLNSSPIVTELEGCSRILSDCAAGGFTVWVSFAELLAKLAFPWKVAVRVLAPRVNNAREQLPEPPTICTTQSFTPSLTVAVPCGVPSSERTLKVTVNGCPGVVGSGLSTSKRVLVLAACCETVTLWVTVAVAPSSSVTVKLTW